MTTKKPRVPTLTGLPVIRLTRLEKAIMRVEQFQRAQLDTETVQACIRYVAQTSGYSYEELTGNMRLNFVG